jgi:Dyp-type peroxidase family
MIEPTPDDLEDIQGIVYNGWLDHAYAGFLFARFGDDPRASRAWLDAQRRAVTAAARNRRKTHGRLHIALSRTGLDALGVPADVVDMLAPEATAGMASRKRVLCDTDRATWQLGGPGDRLDVLVMVYQCTDDARRKRLDEHRRALAGAGATVYADELSQPIADGREHFGFADGLSQPFVPGMHAEPRRGETRVPAGEILLGYPNAYDQIPPTPLWGDFDLGTNGTYLVFRKLQQDVAGFWSWIAGHARRLAAGEPAATTELADLIAAKLVGRWPSGAPLSLTPDADDRRYATPDRRNAFSFLRYDPDGLHCPLTSHVRRANPRDARGGNADESELVVNRHRILRRGRSYGTPLPYDAAIAGRDDGVARGLYFVCLQSSIARGFEFIQQSWLANPGFLGLHREVDPIIGGSGHVTIPAEPVRLRLGNIPPVVINRGGGYFFVPSLRALARIAAGP